MLSFYRLLGNDEARVWSQFLIASLCWGLAAWLLARTAERAWQSSATGAVVLLVSLSMPVVSLDRILQTESLAMSLTILFCALWVNVFTGTGSDLNAWWLGLVMAIATFVRPQVGLIMGALAGLLLLVVMLRRQRVTALMVVPLVTCLLAAGWSVVALTAFDRSNSHDAARAYFMSWYRGTDPGYRAMEQELGRPECRVLDGYTRDVQEAAMHFAWDFYSNSYRVQCPELAAWHQDSAPNYLERLVADPAANARLFVRDLPFLVQPWVRGTSPSPLGPLQATLFGITDQSGMVNTDPQPRALSAFDSPRLPSAYTIKGVSLAPVWAWLIWACGAVVLAVFSRAKGLSGDRQRALGFVALCGSSVIGIIFSWIADAWEMDRHSLPWSTLLPLLVITGVLISYRSRPGLPAYSRPTNKARATMWLCVSALVVSLGWVQAGQQPPMVKPQPLPTSPRMANDLRDRAREVFLDNDEQASAQRIQNLQPQLLPTGAKALSDAISASSSFTVSLRSGVTLTGFLLEPLTVSRCSIIFSGGHGPWWVESIGFIRTALSRGCTVAAVNMPFIEATTTVVRDGVTVNVSNSYSNHFGLQLIATPDDNVLDLFVVGPLSLVDWFSANRPDLPVLMTGFSGGGFVATSTAALDTRIVRSIAVSGSSENLDVDNCTYDYEQCLSVLAEDVTMQDLYFLSAYSSEADSTVRKAGQTLTQYDPCCHAGIPNPAWVANVNSALVVLGADRFIYALSKFQPPSHTIPKEADQMLVGFLKEVT